LTKNNEVIAGIFFCGIFSRLCYMASEEYYFGGGILNATTIYLKR
jgi:hypothetical protein